MTLAGTIWILLLPVAHAGHSACGSGANAGTDSTEWIAWDASGESLGRCPAGWQRVSKIQKFEELGFYSESLDSIGYGWYHTGAKYYTLGSGSELLELWQPNEPNGGETDAAIILGALRDSYWHNLSQYTIKLVNSGWNAIVETDICQTGPCPNAMIVGSTQVATLVCKKRLVALNNFFAEYSRTHGQNLIDEFPKFSYYDFNHDTEWMGVPFVPDIFLLGFNKTALEGIGEPLPPPYGLSSGEWTWPRFADMVCKISREYGNGTGLRMVTWWDDDQKMALLTAQSVGARLSEQGHQCGWNTTGFRDVIDGFWRRIFSENCVSDGVGGDYWRGASEQSEAFEAALADPLNVSNLPNLLGLSSRGNRPWPPWGGSTNWTEAAHSEPGFFFATSGLVTDHPPDIMIGQLPGSYTYLGGTGIVIPRPAEIEPSESEAHNKRIEHGWNLMRLLTAKELPWVSLVNLHKQTTPPIDSLLELFPWTHEMWSPMKSALRRAVPPQYPGASIPEMGVVEKTKPMRFTLLRAIFGNMSTEQAIGDGCMVMNEILRPCDTSRWLTDGRCINPIDGQPGCRPGEQYQLSSEVGFECRPCAKGFSQPNRTASTSCVLCAHGYYSDEKGATECRACDVGWITTSVPATACEPCPPGRASSPPEGSITQQVQCFPCELGFYANGLGNSVCLPCAELLPGSMTLFQGSASPQDCVCPPNTYFQRLAPSAPAKCVPCPYGLICPGGNGPPLQEEKFAASRPRYEGAVPEDVVHCMDNIRCPGNTPLGSCPPHVVKPTKGAACDTCEAGYYEMDGVCKQCDVGSCWAFLVMALVLVLSAVCLYLFALRPASVVSQTYLTITICFGLTINVVQVIGSMRTISLHWPFPISVLLSIFEVFTFDVDILRLSCVFGIHKPHVIYLLSLSMHPIFASTFMVVVLVGQTLHWHIDKVHITNAQGFVVLLLFMSLAFVVVLPWQCVNNPSVEGHGTTSSVAVSRGVICWETEEHRVMLGFSIVAGFLYVVGFTALVAWASWRYPVMVARPSGIDFVRRFQFIFHRFAPHRYYYGFFFLLRNLGIAFLPVIFSNNIQSQLLFMSLLMASSCASQCVLQPWRYKMANYVDTACSVLVILILVSGALLVERDAARTKSVVSKFFTVISGLLFLLLLGVLGSMVKAMTIPRRRYGVFLSHHKEGAAALARWFKLMLHELTPDPVFLDSDELDRLDLIFEIVAFDTKNVVVLCTKEILRRIWCAGEIASAVKRGVKIIPVACGDYTAPTDEFIDNVGSIWTDCEKAEITRLGVEVSHIQDAYRQFRNLKPLRMDRRDGTREEREMVVKAVAMACVGLRRTVHGFVGSAPGIQRKSSGMVADSAVILGSRLDVEAVSICHVMQKMIQRELQSPVSMVSRASAEAMEQLATSTFALVVLTRGCLGDPDFASYVAFLLASDLSAVVPIVADSSFMFPDPAFYKDLSDGLVMDERRLTTGLELEDIALAYKALFSSLAVRFSAHGSHKIQRVEIAEMLPRIQSATAQVATMSGQSRLRISLGSRASTFSIHPRVTALGSNRSSYGVRTSDIVERVLSSNIPRHVKSGGSDAGTATASPCLEEVNESTGEQEVDTVDTELSII